MEPPVDAPQIRRILYLSWTGHAAFCLLGGLEWRVQRLGQVKPANPDDFRSLSFLFFAEALAKAAASIERSAFRCSEEVAGAGAGLSGFAVRAEENSFYFG